MSHTSNNLKLRIGDPHIPWHFTSKFKRRPTLEITNQYRDDPFGGPPSCWGQWRDGWLGRAQGRQMAGQERTYWDSFR